MSGNLGECEFVIEDGLGQIEMLDAEIGAWTYVDHAGARVRARQLDESAERGPLYGMSVGIKDIIDVAGMPTTYGRVARAQRIHQVAALARERPRDRHMSMRRFGRPAFRSGPDHPR